MDTMDKKQSSSSLLVCAVLFSLMEGAGLILCSRFAGFNWSEAVEIVLLAALGFGLYASYRIHAKNVTKMLLGGLLFVILSFSSGIYYMQELDIWVQEGGAGYILYPAATMAAGVVLLLLNINHYAINATHHSSPRRVAFNSALAYVFFAVALLQAIGCLLVNNPLSYQIGSALSNIADAFLIFLAVSIEQRSDDFRLEREAAGKEVPDVTEDAPKGKGKNLLISACLVTLFKAVSIAGGVAATSFSYELPWIIKVVYLICVCFGIYVTYRKHIKNMTKPLAGAALIILLDWYATTAFTYIQDFRSIAARYETTGAITAYMTGCIVCLLAVMAIVLLYISVNLTHASSPKKVRLTHYVSLLFVLASLTQSVSELFFGYSLSTVLFVALDPIAMIFVLCMVLSIMSSAERGREKREQDDASAGAPEA